MQASAYRSSRGSGTRPSNSSQHAYAGVVDDEVRQLGSTSVSLENRCEEPKSSIRTSPEFVIMMFCGFKSACTILRACACSRPDAICCMTDQACGRDSVN